MASSFHEAEEMMVSGAGFRILRDGDSSTVDSLQMSDTLIVVDVQNDFLPCGALAVVDGDKIIPHIVDLIHEASRVGARIIATKDWHPASHCSFKDQGGIHPPHCVVGTFGAEIATTVKDALETAREVNPGRVAVAHKGFFPDVDSYSAFTYTHAVALRRLAGYETQAVDELYLRRTGSFLFGNKFLDEGKHAEQLFYQPGIVSLNNLLLDENDSRIVVCGLALDFCVLDTIRLAAAHGHPTALAWDATRPVYLPGIGRWGSGFLSDPVVWAREIIDSSTLVALSKCFINN